MPAKPSPLPDAHEKLLGELGERLRYARLRRKLTARAVAEAAGITRVTLHRAEHGGPAITAGTLIKVMGVLDLASDFALLARDDRAGRLMQDAQLPRRRIVARTARRPPPRIRIDRYPQLQSIAWHLGPAATDLAPEEAFALYERNWRHVDPAAMGPKEAALLKELTATIGKGVLLV
jgi:transcriptional regulator with XRE-family HTH domain